MPNSDDRVIGLLSRILEQIERSAGARTDTALMLDARLQSLEMHLRELGARTETFDARMAQLATVLEIQSRRQDENVFRIADGLEAFLDQIETRRRARPESADGARSDQVLRSLIEEAVAAPIRSATADLLGGEEARWTITLGEDRDLGGSFAGVDVVVAGVGADLVREHRRAFATRVIAALPPALQPTLVVTVRVADSGEEAARV